MYKIQDTETGLYFNKSRGWSKTGHTFSRRSDMTQSLQYHVERFFRREYMKKHGIKTHEDARFLFSAMSSEKRATFIPDTWVLCFWNDEGKQIIGKVKDVVKCT